MKFVHSLGVKLALVCLICLSVVAVVAAALNTIQINMLEEQMLSGSERLAREKARVLAQELSSLRSELASQPADDQAHRQALLQRIQLFIKRNDEVLLAGVIEVGKDGVQRVVVDDFRDARTKNEFLKNGDSFKANIREGDAGTFEVLLQRHDARTPLLMAPLDEKESPRLQVAMAIRDSATFRQIEQAGNRITQRVTLMASLLSLALILAFVAVYLLVKGQTRLIQENETLNRMAYVGTLAGGLAHEIRNPLNAMSVNLGVVQEDLEDPRPDSEPRVRQIVGRLLHEVDELNQTVTDFMAYAIPRSSERELVEPAAIVQNVLDSLEEQIASRGVRVDTQLETAIEIEADATGLRQVFYNLLMNAIEAMTGALRKLTIRSWREGNMLCMDFSDTGEGIPAEDWEKIFEPFHSAKARGSGFGLPIARRIVREHGGRIWLDSAPGEGTVFHLQFLLPSRQQRG